MTISSRRLRHGVAVLAAVVATTVATPGVASAGNRHVIAYVKNGDIFTAYADGTAVRKITSSGSVRTFGWGPKGNFLVYEVNGDLFRIGADGTGVRQLTSGPAYDEFPAVSPDGRVLAFSRTVSDTDYSALVRMPLRGGAVTTIEPGDDSTDVDCGWFDAHWVSQTVIWVGHHVRCYQGNEAVHEEVVDAGTGAVLSRVPGFDTVPSPDGRSIAYIDEDIPSEDVRHSYLAVQTGDDFEVKLTAHPDSTWCCNDWYPSWSPDSRRVAEVELIAGVLTLRVYPIDGSRGWTVAQGTSYYSAWRP